MLETIKNKTKIKSPRFVPEIKLYCIMPSEIEYPFSPNDFNVMYGYPTWSGIALSRYILDNADKFNGIKISDIGCGSGVASISAAKSGADVTSIDRDVASLYFTEQNCTLNDVKTNIVWGSFNDVETDYVMFSSIFYDKLNSDGINKVLSERKAIVGSLNPDIPDWVDTKMTRIDLSEEKQLYVFTNFEQEA